MSIEGSMKGAKRHGRPCRSSHPHLTRH